MGLRVSSNISTPRVSRVARISARALGRGVHPGRVHRAAGEADQVEGGFDQGGVSIGQAEAFEGRKPGLDFDHMGPVFPEGGAVQVEFVCRGEVAEAGGEAFDAGLVAEVEHAWVVALVTDPDQAVSKQLDGFEEVVRDVAGLFDADDAVDLGKTDEEFRRPGLGVVG